jgi:hypothetical protein
MRNSPRRPVVLPLLGLSVCLAVFVASSSHAAEGSISIDVAMEEGVQITAPSEWLQLLTSLGQRNVNMRSARVGDQPNVEETGTADRPRYRVTALLTRRGELVLPGGRYTRSQSAQIKDYFETLAADGPQRMNAPKGSFDLTKEEFEKVHTDLSQPLATSTKEEKLSKVIDKASGVCKVGLKVDHAAQKVIDSAPPLADEVEGLTLGSGLALLLKRHDLVLVPTKEQGRELTLRIARAGDVRGNSWPVGWDSDKGPRELVPKLFDMLNAEVDGFTLAEAMEAIGPRLEVPVYWDHAALERNKIDPAKINVKYPRRRTHLKNVVDALLFQGRVHGEVRVDEAGRVFYWITR